MKQTHVDFVVISSSDRNFYSPIAIRVTPDQKTELINMQLRKLLIKERHDGYQNIRETFPDFVVAFNLIRAHFVHSHHKNIIGQHE